MGPTDRAMGSGAAPGCATPALQQDHVSFKNIYFEYFEILLGAAEMGTALPKWIRMTKGFCSGWAVCYCSHPMPRSPLPPVQQCDSHELLANPHLWVLGGGEDHAASRGLFSLLLSPI